MPISAGVALFSSGVVSNASSGVISGVYKGVGIYNGPGTVVNAGSIVATGTNGLAVSLTSGFGNLLVDEPGGVFVGIVDGGNTIGSTVSSTLELAASSLQGTMSGLGSQFVDFAQVTIDPGANWIFAGTNSLASGVNLSDDGSLLVSGATLADAGPVVIAGTAGSFAGATVTGDAALWSGPGELTVGGAGVGSLLIEAGGSVTGLVGAVIANQAGSDGSSADVIDASWQVSGTLDVGNAASGALAISAGGMVTVTALDVGVQNTGGAGQIDLAGAGSQLMVTGDATMGDAGTGAMSIFNGATFAATGHNRWGWRQRRGVRFRARQPAESVWHAECRNDTRGW